MTLKQAVAFFVVALIPSAATFAITIDTVWVGNPGNTADTRYIDSQHPNGVGAVAYSFNIGKTEVTNLQYAAFLNAVAASDPYNLYNTIMADSGGIVRNGSDGSYTYSIKPAELNGTYGYENKPIMFISSGDAMRFANWVHNGQPHDAENLSTTEDGAYTLNGALTREALLTVTRNSGARWWIPSENEWYKAAYHKNDGITGNYWDYPTRTDVVPNHNRPSNDTGNSANCFVATGNPGYPLTDSGAYTLSASPYGTFDQGGNAWEYIESLVSVNDTVSRLIRGGAYLTDSSTLRAKSWSFGDPSTDFFGTTFRIAASPIAIGDFDSNGRVEAADYVMWRKTNDTPEQYNVWRANFGMATGNASVLSAASIIPEPSTSILAVSIVALLASHRRRRG